MTVTLRAHNSHGARLFKIRNNKGSAMNLFLSTSAVRKKKWDESKQVTPTCSTSHALPLGLSAIFVRTRGREDSNRMALLWHRNVSSNVTHLSTLTDAHVNGCGHE